METLVTAPLTPQTIALEPVSRGVFAHLNVLPRILTFNHNVSLLRRLLAKLIGLLLCENRLILLVLS